MRVLQSWLKHYISFALSAEELAERLTMLGLEFERIEHLGEKYQNIVVGRGSEVRTAPSCRPVNGVRSEYGHRGGFGRLRSTQCCSWTKGRRSPTWGHRPAESARPRREAVAR